MSQTTMATASGLRPGPDGRRSTSRPWRPDLRVCVVHEGSNAITLPFLRAHLELLPCSVALVHGFLPSIDGRPILSQGFVPRAFRGLARRVRRKPWNWELTKGYLRAFDILRPHAVLAEWGTVAVRVMDACRARNIPLIAHFHGYDASVHRVLADYADDYRKLFAVSGAVVAVSRSMKARLELLGAPPGKVHYNSYGVDCTGFRGGAPADAPPTFIAVGRFVEKKAPHLTLAAYAHVARARPEARLRMIGDGPLLNACRDLARGLGLTDRVDFIGAADTKAIQAELRTARAFVQHSVQAADGDCEGTPTVVLEAGATGLPVVSTRHGGIPDAVIHESTGFLVDEFDVGGMAQAMLRLVDDPDLAGRMGRAARRRMETEFADVVSADRLWSIIQAAIGLRGIRAGA